MEWWGKRGTKRLQLWQPVLVSEGTRARCDSLIINVCYFSAATCSCFPGTDLSGAGCFLSLSLWTHAVFWFNEGNSAENADKRKILIQLRPLARYKWRRQWDRAGAPCRGDSGDWSHARWEPWALCRGSLEAWKGKQNKKKKKLFV